MEDLINAPEWICFADNLPPIGDAIYMTDGEYVRKATRRDEYMIDSDVGVFFVDASKKVFWIPEEEFLKYIPQFEKQQEL